MWVKKFSKSSLYEKILKIIVETPRFRQTSKVFIRQRIGDHFPPVPAALQIPAAHFGKDHVDQIELRDPCGNRAQLEGIFRGAALEDAVRESGAGGAGESGYQNDLCLPLLGDPQNIHQIRFM